VALNLSFYVHVSGSEAIMVKGEAIVHSLVKIAREAAMMLE
jgi:hypothetical protein